MAFPGATLEQGKAERKSLLNIRSVCSALGISIYPSFYRSRAEGV